MKPTMEREYGEQPIDALMLEGDLSNDDLVCASTEQVTHKMVAKARKGRWLTMSVRQKVLRAYNAASGQSVALDALFNYR
jgi:hypothetical protein